MQQAAAARVSSARVPRCCRPAESQHPERRLALGQFGELSRVMSPELVAGFAEVSGDDNPVHLSEEYAAKTRFKKPIAHGMLYSSMISTIFGAQFEGAIYLRQTFEFKRPVFVGDKATAKVTVTDVQVDPYIVTCRTVIEDSAGKVCTDGEASVLLPDPEAAPRA